MEKAILSIDKLYISQYMNGSYSHKGDYAIDISKLKYLKAPFTGVIKKIYKKCNGVWLESINKVKFADGSTDYMTIMTLHDNNISNLKVGMKIKQGKIYYHPGTKGKVTGSHIHIAVAKGKFKGSGWYKNKYNSWCINNHYNIVNALYLDNKVKILKSKYKWVLNNKNSIIYIVKKGDTLSKIAKKFKVKWQDIYKNNKSIIGNNPNIINIGKKLIISYNKSNINVLTLMKMIALFIKYL